MMNILIDTNFFSAILLYILKHVLLQVIKSLKPDNTDNFPQIETSFPCQNSRKVCIRRTISKKLHKITQKTAHKLPRNAHLLVQNVACTYTPSDKLYILKLRNKEFNICNIYTVLSSYMFSHCRRDMKIWKPSLDLKSYQR